MANRDRGNRSSFPPLAAAIFVWICLALALAPSLLEQIINFDTAMSIFIAAGLLSLAVISNVYTKRFALFTIGALLVGGLFYANSVVCYTLGFFPLNPLFGNHLVCSWSATPYQASHGAAMLVLGLGMALIAARSILTSKARKPAEKGLEFALLCAGVIQAVIGIIALIL